MVQKSFGDEFLSRKFVYQWYKRFRKGREFVENKPRV